MQCTGTALSDSLCHVTALLLGMHARRAETPHHHQTRHGCEAHTKVLATLTLHHIKWHDYLSLPPPLLILLQPHISHPLCLWDYTSNLSLPYQPLLWQLPANAEWWEYIGLWERARVQYLYPASARNYRADLASNNRWLTRWGHDDPLKITAIAQTWDLMYGDTRTGTRVDVTCEHVSIALKA